MPSFSSAIMLSLISFCLFVRVATADVGACPGNTTADEMTIGFNLSTKIVVVTGGDSGLGFAIAEAFARRGARVIIGSHNATKGEEAAEYIADATGSDVLSLHVDYTSFSSVRTFAAQVRARVPSLNFLVNDAGIRSDPKQKTEDGYDTAFQVNYLGHFLLTELLLPLLRNGRPSRVISTSGSLEDKACEFAGWPQGCLADWSHLPPEISDPNPKRSSSIVAIFLKIQHAAELARREQLSGIEAFSFEPGLAITPLTEAMNLTRFCEHMPVPRQEPCPYTADQAVSVALSCALYDVRSGGYFSRTLGCEEATVGMNGFTDDMRPELYRRSLEWVGLAAGSDHVVIV